MQVVYLLQDALPLHFFKVLLLNFEGAVEQLQLGGVSLQVDLGALLIRLPSKHCHKEAAVRKGKLYLLQQ